MTGRKRFLAVPGAQVKPGERASGYDSAVDAARSAELFNEGIGVSAFLDDFHDGCFGDGGPWPWAVVDTEPPT